MFPGRSLVRSVSITAIGLFAVAGFTACEPTPPTPTTVPPRSTLPPRTTNPPIIKPPSPKSTTTTVPTPGFVTVDGDEFNAPALDGTHWKAYFNTYGDGNLELACLTPGNVTFTGSSVKIAARKEVKKCPNVPERNYTSGFLGSRDVGKFYPLEGRFEMRAKLPHSQGLWPAFWLRHAQGASNAEVDIMEHFHSATPGKTSNALHFPGTQRTNALKVSKPFEAPTATPGWHTWAVEIDKLSATQMRFVFFLDDVETGRFVDTQADTWMNKSPANASWDIAVNLAVGGRWTGEPDGTLGVLPLLNPVRCSQSGTYPACNTAGIRRVDWNNLNTTTMEVDYVRFAERTN